jgi:hypothetical protein
LIRPDTLAIMAAAIESEISWSNVTEAYRLKRLNALFDWLEPHYSSGSGKKCNHAQGKKKRAGSHGVASRWILSFSSRVECAV